MKIIRRCTLLLLTLFLAAMAQNLPQTGRTYQARSVDLNGDGKMEKVVLVAYGIDHEMQSYFGRLKVLDSGGKVLWAAPAAAHADEPFAFGSWPYGGSDLEWVGDIDGDGRVELLSPLPVSDLRPPTYRLFRWSGTAFVPAGVKMLLQEGENLFVWREPIEWDGMEPITWVSKVEGEPGAVTVEVTSFIEGGEVLGGQALVQGTKDGMKVRRWVRELGPPT